MCVRHQDRRGFVPRSSAIHWCGTGEGAQMIQRLLFRAIAKRALLFALASGFLALGAPPWAGAGILLGTPTTTVPSSLSEPLSTLSSPLPNNEFLLPVEITGASGLQNWSFDVNFTAGVVIPVDAGGFFQSVYQAEFNVSDPTLSDILSGGLLVPGSLLGIAGFSSGVSGDGLLAFVLFQQLMPGVDPGFSISNAVINQAPEPWNAGPACQRPRDPRRPTDPARTT